MSEKPNTLQSLALKCAGVLAVALLPTAGPASAEVPVCNAGGPYAVECSGTTTAINLDGSGASDPGGNQGCYRIATRF